MASALSGSHQRFEIPGVASVVQGNGGLPKVRIITREALGEMYLHGAHVTSWRPAGGEEVFFLSSKSRWEHGRAIRGGVPISFPWFAARAGDPQAPSHGFVRTKAWQLESIAQAEGTVAVSMSTTSDEETACWWPGEFHLLYRATFGLELKLELVATNTGKTPLRFEEALHAYHRVGDIKKMRVHGLDAVRYLDKTDSNQEKTQRGEIEITSETDRVYLNTADAVELHDPVFRRRTHVTKENSRTTVVWNPWAEKARAISDLAEGEWTQMVCIETSNVSDFAVDLAPGGQHGMKALVRAARL